jgi:hypothetical protein
MRLHHRHGCPSTTTTTLAPPPWTFEDRRAPPCAVFTRSALPPPGPSTSPCRPPSTPRPRGAAGRRPVVFTAPSSTALDATPLSRSTAVMLAPQPLTPTSPSQSTVEWVPGPSTPAPRPSTPAPRPSTSATGPQPLPHHVFFEFCIKFENCLDEN